jgi:hypothetical protein
MAIKISSLKADLKRENEGDWVPYPELGDPDVAFKVRAVSNAEFQAKRDRESKKLSQQYGSKTIPQEEFDRAQGRLLAEEILLDWKGLDVPYSPHFAEEILTDPAHRAIREAVVACAIRLTEIRVEFVEAAVKNSAPPSAKS